MHIDDYKVHEFPSCASTESPAWAPAKAVQGRILIHFLVSSSDLFAAERHCGQTTLILRQTRCECIPSPIISGQIVFEHVLLRDQVLGSSAVCADATEYEMQQDRVHRENNGRRPRGWIRRTCAHWRRGLRYREVATNIPCTVKRLLPRGTRSIAWFKYFAITFRNYPTPRARARFVFPLDTLIFWVRAGYLGGSELPHRIHRFIMLRIPSADNHVLRVTRFAWNSRSFELTREHYMHNTIRCIPFAQS